MRIRKLVWFEEIIEKLVHKHRVSQSEVREILARKRYEREKTS